MTAFDEMKTMIFRNKLLGMWAAEKLKLSGAEADAYSSALAVGTLEAESSDVFKKIRVDFDAAGVVQSDEQILTVMNDLLLKANQASGTGGGDVGDAASVALARKLTSG